MFYIDNKNKLVYVNSQNIKVFPCGRRKSEFVENGEQKRYIPIDPEARLNTEANNRKHSGLNGYKQNYLNYWNSGKTGGAISIVLAGYLFDIKLTEEYYGTDTDGNNIDSENAFGTALANRLRDAGEAVGNELYVNIVTADMKFFSSVDGTGTADSLVSTEILRDQALTAEPSACLDLPKILDGMTAADYYFSGLSFSAEPLEKQQANQHVTSMQLLTRKDDKWRIYEPSRLPKIDHGDTENSVKISGSLAIKHYKDDKGNITPGDLSVEGNINVDGSLTASDVIIKGPNGDMKAITLEVAEDAENKWQLKFYNAKTSPYNK